MLNIKLKIMLFYNFKYVKNLDFSRREMPGFQIDISLFPAMMLVPLEEKVSAMPNVEK